MNKNYRLLSIVGLATAIVFCDSVVHGANVATVDLGGGRSTNATYVFDTSIGTVGASASATGVKSIGGGYVSQLTEVKSLTVTGTPTTVNETATSQLSGTAALDDATTNMLAGADINWTSTGYPIASISGSGLATPSAVYANTNAVVRGYYLGASNLVTLAILDNNGDNYGIYAGDGLPDSWQVQYFGTNNANGVASADADGTGQNNLFKYVAGLDPTNPASVFVLQIQNVGGQPNQKNLIFNPIAGGRTYTPQFRTNLVSGAWATLTGIGGPTTNVNQVTVTDLSATQTQKFYRIDISLP